MKMAGVLMVSILRGGQIFAADSDSGKMNGADELPEGKVSVQPDLPGFRLPFANTSVDLGLATTRNPGMRVLVQQGYYDLSTPHLATGCYMDHLNIADELRDNIELQHYEAGHMMYVHMTSLVKRNKDLAVYSEQPLGH